MLSLWIESGSYSICCPCECRVRVTRYAVPVNWVRELLSMLSLWMKSGSYSICCPCEWRVGVTRYAVPVNGERELLDMLSLWIESGSYSIRFIIINKTICGITTTEIRHFSLSNVPMPNSRHNYHKKWFGGKEERFSLGIHVFYKKNADLQKRCACESTKRETMSIKIPNLCLMR